MWSELSVERSPCGRFIRAAALPALRRDDTLIENWIASASKVAKRYAKGPVAHNNSQVGVAVVSLVESRIPAGYAHLDEALLGRPIVDSAWSPELSSQAVSRSSHGVLQRELSKTDMTEAAMSSRHGAAWT